MVLRHNQGFGHSSLVTKKSTFYKIYIYNLTRYKVKPLTGTPRLPYSSRVLQLLQWKIQKAFNFVVDWMQRCYWRVWDMTSEHIGFWLDGYVHSNVTPHTVLLRFIILKLKGWLLGWMNKLFQTAQQPTSSRTKDK